jgi:hypothetical protein
MLITGMGRKSKARQYKTYDMGKKKVNNLGKGTGVKPK